MATMMQLETALRNADAAGDMDAARKLAAVIGRARQDVSNQIPDMPVSETIQRPAEPTLGEQAIGAGEAALTLATGATGGAIGMIGGTLKGLAEQILAGHFGTPEAAQLVEQSAAEGAQALTYAPRTPSGQSQAMAVGEAAQSLIPISPLAAEMGMIAQGARAAVPAVTDASRRAMVPIQKASARVAEPVQRATRSVGEAMGREPAQAMRGAGSAETELSAQRIATAEGLPVPFTGESALTTGQASGKFLQLQFEKETAKLGEIGAPLRKRVENQTATMIQNFDSMVHKIGPIAVEKRDIGKVIDKALVNKVNVVKKRIQNAYEKARESGEMQSPVEMDALSARLAELQKYEGISPVVAAVRKESQRLGAVKADADGNLIPGQVSLSDSELLRQFVNEATDWTDRRDALMARRINEAIDASTEGKGGELYQAARRLHKSYVNEFENVGLTAKLMGTKRGTSERQIAFDDVFDKIVLVSSVEEMNKFRSTLLRAGAEGKQAWTDVKAAGIEHIKESSLSASQMDSAGQPLLSVDKLNRVVNSLDREGKLESLYGKKQSQDIRDLAKLSKVIYTAPPGAVNTSNTASAIRNMIIDMGVTGVATGVPAPVYSTLKIAAKYVKDRKLQARINAALNRKREK